MPDNTPEYIKIEDALIRMEFRALKAEGERDSYKKQAHNLGEQRIACLREISDLKARLERLDARYVSASTRSLLSSTPTRSVAEVLSERLVTVEAERDALKAHVRTLQEAAEDSISYCELGCTADSYCGRCEPLVTALAATEDRP